MYIHTYVRIHIILKPHTLVAEGAVEEDARCSSLMVPAIYIYIYIYMYIYMYVYIYIHTYIHTYIHVHIYIYIYINM
jgi:hypothetical protein